jgi:hypothetical protein
MPYTNNSPITPFPQVSPTISGVDVNMSVYLNTPARVQKAITDFTVQRFVMPHIFSRGPQATGGAVIYDQVLGTFFFLDRDAQPISPGSQFPILAGGEQLPSVAAVRKLGGEVLLTYEAVRRDNRNLLAREMMRLGNTVVRYVDAAAVAALNAAPILTSTAVETWTTSGADPLYDIATASELVYGPDLGYVPDTILMNPADHAVAVKNTTLRSSLPRENFGISASRLGPDHEPTGGGNLPNPIFGGFINQLEGLTIYLTNRVPAGTIYVLAAGMVGSYSDEVPEYYKILDEPREETYYIHGARVMVPYVTDPLACVKVTGIG